MFAGFASNQPSALLLPPEPPFAFNEMTAARTEIAMDLAVGILKFEREGLKSTCAFVLLVITVVGSLHEKTPPILARYAGSILPNPKPTLSNHSFWVAEY